MGQQTKEYEWKKSPTRSPEMGQVLSDKELEQAIGQQNVLHLAHARHGEMLGIIDCINLTRIGRAVEAAVIAKLGDPTGRVSEAEARHREQKAFASGGLWVSPCSLPVAGITHVTCTHCERIAKEAFRRYPLPTKPREVKGPSGAIYKIVDGYLMTAETFEKVFRRDACIPSSDFPVVSDLLQHPGEPA